MIATSIEAMIAAAERELRMRQSVYPRRVADRKMSKDSADRETQAMADIAEVLRRLKEHPDMAEKLGAQRSKFL
jgi:hypothetical protein